MNTEIKNRLIAFAETKNGKGIQSITDKQLVADLKSLFPADFFFKTPQLTVKKMAALVLLDFKEPICEHCGNSVSLKFTWPKDQTTPERATVYGAWSRVCSASCGQYTIVKDGSRAKTIQERYGVKNIMQKPGFAKNAMKNRKTDWVAAGISQQKSSLLKRGVLPEFVDSIDFNDPVSKVKALINVATEYEKQYGCIPTRADLCKVTNMNIVMINRWLYAIPEYSHLYRLPKNISKQQLEIKQWLETLGVSVKMSDRTVISPREIDLLIPDKNIGIEYCGVWCHSEGFGSKNSTYHITKTISTESKGYQLLTIYDTEWLDPNKQDIWKSIIKHKFGMTENRLYARNCKLCVIDSKTSNQFMEDNHLQGYVKTSNHIGLFHNDELVAAISFGKSRTSDQTEIIRLATKKNFVVVGGVSKLINYVKRQCESILCFADRRYSSILKCGYSNTLSYTGDTGPNWWGFNNSEYVLYSRHKFMKHKLQELFKDNYDNEKTAFENMIDNKYDRIWDSGSLKFEWIK